MSAALNNQTAVKFLLLAQKYGSGLDDVRAKCCDHLVKLQEVDKLKNLKGFQDLDANSINSILLQQLEECQSCLREVLPQLVGLMEFTAYSVKFSKHDKLTIRLCSEHYQNGDNGTATRESEWRLRHCPACQEMFKRIHTLGKDPNRRYKYGHSLHFNEQIVETACRVMNILGTPESKYSWN